MTSSVTMLYTGHRFTSLVTALFTLGLTFLALPVSAQTNGPDTFDITESALTGTVACNGGTPTPIANVDASTTDASGSNDDQASSLSANACGFPLYAIGSANDATSASDTSSQDNGDGTGTVQQVSLLGGVVTYDAKSETDTCTATDSQGDASCTNTTTVQNLNFAGQHITGTFTQPTTFQATDVQVQLLQGDCTGVALFTGTLTVAAMSTQGQGTNVITQTMSPVALQGTLTCIGLPLSSITVNLRDYAEASIYCPMGGEACDDEVAALVIDNG